MPGHSPRRVSYPSKNSTLPQPFHITVAVAPLPLSPCRARPLLPVPLPVPGLEAVPSGILDFEAFLRCRARNARATVASREAPYPSMGFVPLRGPSSDRGLPGPRSVRRVVARLRRDNRPSTSSAPSQAVSLRRRPGSTGAARKRLWCLASTLVPGCPGPIGARCGGSDPSAGSIPAESVRSRSG